MIAKVLIIVNDFVDTYILVLYISKAQFMHQEFKIRRKKTSTVDEHKNNASWHIMNHKVTCHPLLMYIFEIVSLKKQFSDTKQSGKLLRIKTFDDVQVIKENGLTANNLFFQNKQKYSKGF